MGITQAVSDFLLNIFKFPEIVTVLIAIIPVIEVRGSIPFAMDPAGLGMHPFFAWLYSFLGASAIVPLLLLVLLPFINFLRRTKWFKKIGDTLYEKFAKGAKSVQKNDTEGEAAENRREFKKMLGVFIFVAIPLPLTGVWTGCAVAAVCGLKYRKSLLAVIAGNLVASSIMVTLCVLLNPFITYITWGIFIIAALIILALIFKIIFSKRKNPMKYVVILGDGMSDYPDGRGQTPLSKAAKPNIDRIARVSEVGLCKTIPDGMKPGSDTANMSVMGLDPAKYYTGRSPLEAISMGISLGGHDITYRINLVTLSGEKDYAQKSMLDYSGGEIETAEAQKLIELLKPIVPKGFELFAGVSYRHCLVQREAAPQSGSKSFTPPHNITGKKITEHLPSGEGSDALLSFMKKSYEILSAHPSNRTKANSAWIWGEGTKPMLPDFFKEYGVRGAVISAVDLIKGIGIGSNMTSIDVPGATGNLNTNFEGKAQAAIDALNEHDYVYLHIEAPDECGHQGDEKGKIRAIELIDEKIAGPVFEALKGKYDFKMLIIPDHATPLKLGSHTSDPVPYILYDSKNEKTDGPDTYSEESAKSTGIFVDEGGKLIKKMLERS